MTVECLGTKVHPTLHVASFLTHHAQLQSQAMRSGLASNSNLRYFAIETHFKPVIRAKYNHARVQGRGSEAGTFESLLDIPTVALAAVRHHLLGQSLSISILSMRHHDPNCAPITLKHARRERLHHALSRLDPGWHDCRSDPHSSRVLRPGFGDRGLVLRPETGQITSKAVAYMTIQTLLCRCRDSGTEPGSAGSWREYAPDTRQGFGTVAPTNATACRD